MTCYYSAYLGYNKYRYIIMSDLNTAANSVLPKRKRERKPNEIDEDKNNERTHSKTVTSVNPNNPSTKKNTHKKNNPFETNESKKKIKTTTLDNAELSVLFQGSTASTLTQTGQALVESFAQNEEESSINVLSLIFKNST